VDRPTLPGSACGSFLTENYRSPTSFLLHFVTPSWSPFTFPVFAGFCTCPPPSRLELPIIPWWWTIFSEFRVSSGVFSSWPFLSELLCLPVWPPQRFGPSLLWVFFFFTPLWSILVLNHHNLFLWNQNHHPSRHNALYARPQSSMVRHHLLSFHFGLFPF